MNLRCQRGETLIEVMVAIAVMTFVLGATLGVVRHMLDAEAELAQRHADYAQIEQLASAWETESRTAEAITVPSPACPEVEFFSRDPNGSAYHVWSYRWDAAAKTVTRYASDGGAIAPCAGTATGRVVATGVTAFTATKRLASSLPGATDAPYAVAGGINDAAVPLGIFEADGTTPVPAGNGFVEIAITGPQSQRTIELLPGIAPSGYTLALQYACNARCDPGAPHDGSRVNQCASTYTVTSAYPTQLDTTNPAKPPLLWSIQGRITYTYFGSGSSGDTRIVYDDFDFTIAADPNNGANNDYPLSIVPIGSSGQVTDLTTNVQSGAITLSPAISSHLTTCSNMASPLPVYQND